MNESTIETIVRPQVPPGHIYVNEKWKNSEIYSLLSRMSFDSEVLLDEFLFIL